MINLFQTDKDIKSSNDFGTFFNNQMYYRGEIPKVHWMVWTDTVKWQYVSHMVTFKMLEDAYKIYSVQKKAL